VNIGGKLRFYRGQNGMTLKELAERTGLSISFISDIENGRKNPSVENLQKLADGLGVNTSELMNEKEPVELQTPEVGFNTPEEAIKFILEQNVIMGFGGFDVNRMSDEEVVEFANELLRQLKLISYKYKK